MKTTTLDGTDETISQVGLGGMHLSLEGRPPEEEAIEVLHRALDLGVTFIDTADSYCIDDSDTHHNERLIARALDRYEGDTSSVVVATKGGLLRPEGRWVADGDPDRLESTIRESYEALGGDEPIDLWQLHAPDSDWEIEESLRPAAESVEAGLIRHVGVSNFSVEQIERARSVVDVVSVQNQWNPWHRDPEFDGVLEYCEDQNLTFLPWSPFGGSSRAGQISDIEILNTVARRRDVSPHRVLLAWMRATSPAVLPIPGATRTETLEDSIASVKLELTDDEVAAIDSGLPA